ncbi:hypothetical protein B0H14DRAFT_1605262 [Mycena olivaceomarginata]|nr:hypothetical protein B0H14DRAFT_1605262 [Mycena olivaceomarginata]
MYKRLCTTRTTKTSEAGEDKGPRLPNGEIEVCRQKGSAHLKGSTRGAKPRALFCSLLLSPTFDASFSLFSRLSLSSSIMAMRLSLFTALATSLFLVSIPSSTAQDSGGLSPDQQCLLNCSLTAVTASGCDVQDTPCICGSSVYASNVTQCAESTCSVPASVRHRFPGRWMRG